MQKFYDILKKLHFSMQWTLITIIVLDLEKNNQMCKIADMSILDNY